MLSDSSRAEEVSKSECPIPFMAFLHGRSWGGLLPNGYAENASKSDQVLGSNGPGTDPTTSKTVSFNQGLHEPLIRAAIQGHTFATERWRCLRALLTFASGSL